jgi:hypothetical protein
MKSLPSEKLRKLCRRCNRNYSADAICAACKNELIALYDNKLTWRTAFEIERISKRAMRFTRDEAEEESY